MARGGRGLHGLPSPTPPPTLRGLVDDTLAALPLEPADAAIAGLALRLAATIDAAAELAEAAAAVPYDPDTAMQVARLRQRVEAHVVMAEVGPKLQAALAALQATPAARAAAVKPPAGGRKSKLAALRQGAAGA